MAADNSHSGGKLEAPTMQNTSKSTTPRQETRSLTSLDPTDMSLETLPITQILYHQFTYAMSGPEQVWFAVYCDSADAMSLSVDDFAFPDGTTQGFDEGTPGVPGHWPSFNQYVYGTTTDQWVSATSGSYPTCTPPEGTYMAEYISWSISSGTPPNSMAQSL